MRTRSREGTAPSYVAKRVARLGFASILVALIATAFLGFRTVRSSSRSSWWVDHTLAVERELAALSAANGDVRATYLELVITGRDASALVAPARAAVQHLDQVAVLTIDNESQQRRVADLRTAFDAAFALETAIIAARARSGEPAATALGPLEGGDTQRELGRVRSIIGDMTNEEERLLRERQDRASRDVEHETTIGGLLALFALLATGAGYGLIRSDERASRAALDAIRERNDKQAALVRTRARLSALYEAGILGIVVATADRRVIEINDALLTALGYSREELLSGSVPWPSLTPPEWAATDTRAMAQLEATGIAALREKEYVRKDGARVPVMVGSTRLSESDGETISFVLDLTANRQAAVAVEHLRQVRASEGMLRGLLEAAPDAVVVVDHEGKIFFVNTQTEALFGYSRGELLGHDASILVPERFMAAYARDRAAFAADPSVRRMSSGLDLSGRRKDGGEFPIEISRGRLETHDGVLISCSIRDVALRKATEHSLTTANRELEAFSYSVAHDLRAPLRGMNGFAQVLLNTYADKLDVEGKDWLNEILFNAKKMGDLIDALLSLARVTRSELRIERVDLSQVARGVVAQLEATSPRSVAVSIATDLSATMDLRLARALLTNLLANAWKFTANVPLPAITFGALDVDGVPTFFVRDNGAGFDMAFAGKLFAPFQRLHTNAEFAGTGIGLATVQRIVHRHQGKVWAEGAVGDGATFFFTLPSRRIGAIA